MKEALILLAKIFGYLAIGYANLLILIYLDDNAENLVQDNDYMLAGLVILWPLAFLSLIYWIITEVIL